MSSLLRRARPRVCLVAVIMGISACSRPLFDRGRRPVENWSAAIPGDRFKVIATIAGGAGRTDMRMSVNVREQLVQAGWTAVRRSGRWDDERAAVEAICAPGDQAVDGVLLVWYDRLRLVDCATGKTAYEIESNPMSGGAGLTGLSQRLMQYLRGEKQRR